MHSLVGLLAHQDGLVSRRQAQQFLTDGAIRHRLRGDGPWQRVLPGVFAAVTGALTEHQRRRAALLYAGQPALLAAATAAAAHGLTAVPGRHRVDVLVPHAVRVVNVGFLAVTRTRQFPSPYPTLDGLPTTPLTRAVIDTGCALADLRSVRALVAEAVQRGFTTVARMERELDRGSRPGSGLVRRVVEEVAAGVRSAPEAEFRDAVAAALLPEPLWNHDLYDVTGRWLGRPDAWWPAARLAYEIDSVRWHLSPEDWERTVRKHNRMQAAGVTVLHASPARLRADRSDLLVELAAAYSAGMRLGPLAGVLGVPHHRRVS